MNHIFFQAFLGGILIGTAVLILFLFLGKIAGNSGIIGSLLTLTKNRDFWKVFYVLGLLLGGILYQNISLEKLQLIYIDNTFLLICAGLLVGFGTRLGSGCTSGHGICGMARFSKRSISATIIFMGTAIITHLLITSLM